MVCISRITVDEGSGCAEYLDQSLVFWSKMKSNAFMEMYLISLLEERFLSGPLLRHRFTEMCKTSFMKGVQIC